jgi:hypothetical protein
MIVHEIHDLSNTYVTELLKRGLSDITEAVSMKNYHPDFVDSPENLFHILKQGRYVKGKYYVLEENGNYIGSGGWNEYELDTTTALMLTRLYIKAEHRFKFYAGNCILPRALPEAVGKYKQIWITVNEYNKHITNWFDSNKTPRIGWPTIYANFVPIGNRTVYHTDQYVIEYQPSN